MNAVVVVVVIVVGYHIGLPVQSARGNNRHISCQEEKQILSWKEMKQKQAIHRTKGKKFRHGCPPTKGVHFVVVAKARIQKHRLDNKIENKNKLNHTWQGRETR